MKTIYYFLLSLWIVCPSFLANAQKGFHIGAGIGFNSVWIINQNTYGGPELEYAPKFGLSYDGAFGYNITSRIGFQTEIGVAHQGQKYEDINSDGDPILRDIDLRYMHIPIMFKFMGGSSDTRFYMMLGPQLNYLQSASIHQSVASESTDIPAKSYFENQDIGLALGLGADIMLNENFYLNTGLRFYYGFTDINSVTYRQQYDTNFDGEIDRKDKPYEKSTNFYGGFTIGIHYLFNRNETGTETTE